MTEPSQYFKGRTVQEQMDEVIGYVDVRSAEVATTAIAGDVAQVHQDMLDADADAAAAAASAAAAAGTLANAVKKTGEASQSIAGDIAVAGTLSGGVVTGTVITAPTPVNNTDAATKKYVDDADALKLNIADVNTVAVGLTGNQNKTGILGFFTSPKNASLYERLSTAGDWVIGKIPTPAQTVNINAIVASREFTGLQLWNISVFTDGTITVTDQLGGTPPTIKHMIKDGDHFLAVTTTGNNVHYSVKWFMCRMGGTIFYMETTNLPIQADSTYVDVNA